MDVSDLKKIGLTEGEVRVYSALLDLGETTRTELAKKSGISPSKIYDVANRLLEKGIISRVKKNGVLHFHASNPDKLNEFIERKENDLIYQKKLISKILPTLQAKYLDNSEKTDVEVFYGWEGLKTAYWDLANTLKKGDENLIFGASKGKNVKQADIFFSQYYKKANRSGYKIRIIFNEELRKYKDRVGYFEESKLHETRYLLNETFSEINLYKNKVMLIMLLDKPILIRITNEEAAESFRTFFETLWKSASE